MVAGGPSGHDAHHGAEDRADQAPQEVRRCNATANPCISRECHRLPGTMRSSKPAAIDAATERLPGRRNMTATMKSVRARS